MNQSHLLLLSGFLRLLNQAARKNTGNPESQARRKSSGEPNGTRRAELRIPSPISAPASPYASPVLSPLNLAVDHLSPKFNPPPSIFQVWSAPEMPHSGDPTLGFPYQFSPEKIAFSVDNSPHHSPRVSPTPSMKSPSRPASPSLNILPNETPMLRRDNSSQSNVHPLPLPPSAAAPSQPSPSLPVTPIQELVPIKGQWQKGKLIGRGTFGSVYVASNRYTRSHVLYMCDSLFL